MKRILMPALFFLVGMIIISGCGSTERLPSSSSSTTTTISPTTSSTLSVSTTTTTVPGATTTTTTTSTTTTTTTTLPDFSWTEVTSSAGFSPRYGHSGVVFDHGGGEKMWIIGGRVDTTPVFTSEVWASSDGLSWELVTGEAAFSPRYQHTSVVFDNKMWVIGGMTSSGLTSEVWSSVNGAAWELVTGEAAFGPMGYHTSVVFDNKMWVIAGIKGSLRCNEVWSSVDGQTWVQETAAADFSARVSHISLVFDNKIWVIAGEGDFIFDDVWSSSNGIGWGKVSDLTVMGAPVGTSEVARENGGGIVFDVNGQEHMFITGGLNNWDAELICLNDMKYSSDGISWPDAPATSFYPGRSDFATLVFNGKIWVIGGYADPSLYNDVWYSPKP